MTATTKHKYSTYALIFLLILFVIGVGLSIDIGDRSHRCTENQFLRVLGGVWSCHTESPVFAEGYFHNHTNPLTVSIAAANTYYNITGFNMGHSLGVVWSNDGIDINTTGYYKFSGSVSFSGGNNGDYDYIMTNNGLPLLDCSMERTATSTATGNVGLTCIEYMKKGDHLNIQVRDLNAPSQDVSITVMNLNIFMLK